MIASTHLAVGAISGLYVQKYLPPQSGILERMAVGFCAGVMSHIIVDAVPHQEYTVQGLKLGVVLLVEIGFIFAFVFYFSRESAVNWIIFGGMAGGAVPDLLGLVYRYIVAWGWLDSLSGLVHLLHGEVPIGLEVSFSFQILLAMLAILLVKLRTT